MIRGAAVQLVMGALCLVLSALVLAQTVDSLGARIWIGREAQFERFIVDADVVDIEDIGIGVTNPKVADLAPGGLVERISFKPLRPGNYQGHWESYESEIAAYELDKLLQLGMIPPTVEKRIGGATGAATMWVSPTQSFRELGGTPSPPAAQIGKWNYELIRAKMFHNLINNEDPNLGNWLVDPAWNIILIDNSRAFTRGTKMVHRMTRIDRDLWDRMLSLDESTLATAVGKWLRDGEIRAVLNRRDVMAEIVQQMVDTQGEAAVFVRMPGTPTRVQP